MSTRTSHESDKVQILTDDGTLVDGADPPDLSDATFVDMYAQMKLCRRFDERAVSLQRQGRSGTYSTMLGHEGCLVGSAFALDQKDWIVPYYRDQGATVTHGLDLHNILLYYMGHEQGSVIPESTNVMPISITIADHIPHATGIAWASKLKGDGSSVVCYFGDGATSEGDFHEGLNFAGVFNTPNVFFCMNNKWAISTPVERQTATETIAQKAQAYGFDGVRVDGMDPLAVYQVTNEALAKSKSPGPDERRPTLVEADLYRIGAHNTSDDPSNYRNSEEAEEWKQHDPLDRFERFLRNTDRLDDEAVDDIEAEVEERISEAVDVAESYETDPDAIFDHVYADAPAQLQEQREYLRALREAYGDDALLEE